MTNGIDPALTSETHPSAPRIWSEVGSVHSGAITAANGAARIAQGDRFARESTAIGPQAFAAFTA